MNPVTPAAALVRQRSPCATPRASVIMPCYNHGSFVTESVEAILAQTFTDLELIVVDDASKDDSVRVLRELERRDPRVKLIVHEQNRGASRSRNDGLRAGVFIAVPVALNLGIEISAPEDAL